MTLSPPCPATIVHAFVNIFKLIEFITAGKRYTNTSPFSHALSSTDTAHRLFSRNLYT